MSHRFSRNGWPRSVEFLAPVAVTGNATPHTEGAYSEIDASVASDVCMVGVRTINAIGTAAADTSMLLTLAVGAAAAEVDIVINLSVGAHGVAIVNWLPIHIPAGSRIAAKIRAEQVSDVYDLALIEVFGSLVPHWGGYAACDTFGADTANSKGTNISSTAGVWTEIVASTTNSIRAFTPSFGIIDSTAGTNVHVVDVGVGAGGSEVIIGTWHVTTSSNEQLTVVNGLPFIERPIPAGSRLAIKHDVVDDLSALIHGWR